ncbi:pickpocket protein 28-like [Musca vetustissima]|uniref:pickpocket protein 28-like n=1 Tax=Musca vetustissima TaxID=27455 RepID=UPI002AB69D82|nr:pickpocket protein 28-like [Musca vetustissima]
MIVYCKFGDVEESCTDLFREVLLDEGLCCVFNQIHPFFLFKQRMYYLLSFLICFICGLYMAIYFLNKWQNTPVIISLSSKPTPISSLPFPTVTICNMNQIQRSNVEKFSVNSPEYAYSQKICFQKYNYTKFHNFTKRSKSDLLSTFIVENAQSCEEMIVYCKFGDIEETCTDLFREVLLDEGLCCVFNQLHPYYLFKKEFRFIRDFTNSNGRTTLPVKWTFEEGYGKDFLPKRFFPRKTPGPGSSKGLRLVLNADINNYYCSSTNGAGFKMMLYNPVDTPYIKEYGLPIAIGRQTRVRIQTKITEAAPTLRQVSPKNRQCYFSDEKVLKFFHYYTRHNCIQECDAEMLYAMCGCLPYYLPIIRPNVTTCSLKYMECVGRGELLMSVSNVDKCKSDCLSGCHEITHSPDMFSSLFTQHDFYHLPDKFFHNRTLEDMKNNLAIVTFFYKTNNIRGYTKAPYTGLTEFLSQTGGIMSLMVGFSVICVGEVFYFGFLKIFFDINPPRQPEKLTEEDEKEINSKENLVSFDN